MMKPVSAGPAQGPRKNHGDGQGDLGESHDLHVEYTIPDHLRIIGKQSEQTVGKEKKKNPMPAISMTARRFASYAESRASAGLPAPRFCPTMVAVATAIR